MTQSMRSKASPVKKMAVIDSSPLSMARHRWAQFPGSSLLLYYLVWSLLPMPQPPSSSVSSPFQSPVKSFLMFAEAGVMKKMKEKMKDKKKEKEKGGGCVPEIVAIKKTRIVPVAVPVKSYEAAGGEYDSYSAPKAPENGKYSSPPQYPAAPASSPYMMPATYGGTSPGVSGYGGGGYAPEAGMSGYADEQHNDHEDEHEDDDDEGYEEHEEAYGVEGDAAVGYESDGHGSDDDEEYRRRSGNESQSSPRVASTSSSVIEYTSLVSEEPSKSPELQTHDPTTPQRRSKRESMIAFMRGRRSSPRLRPHPSGWRMSGSVFFMQQSSW